MAKFLVPDDIWAVITPLLPQARARPKGGWPPIQDRAALTGILFEHLMRSYNAFKSWGWERISTALLMRGLDVQQLFLSSSREKG